ncbi:hypothetical protein C823_003850 [Eubacterium plexicaudatum ASF492]|nr:hypothetical protein C823_003850 [Eubacterium plexicaudatum ASF492]
MTAHEVINNKVYADKKEAGAAFVEMCREMKTVNVPATVGEYAGFKMAVSFDSFNHKFVMNLKGQLSEAQTKLETVERQLETAKAEVTKPFAQEAELAEKLERLSALNALLNMEEKGDDAIGMDDAPEEENGGQETSGHNVRKPGQTENVSEQPETGEKAANVPIPYPVENARHDYTADSRGLRVAAAMADKPVQRASLKEKLAAYKAQVSGAGRADTEKAKRKEETL